MSKRLRKRITALEKEVDLLNEMFWHLDGLVMAYRERMREHEHDTDGRTMWDGKRSILQGEDSTP